MTHSASDQTPVLAHQPALDGLRGVAVALVLLFHLGLSWMPGGYLGVSVFFTLSGFLITSLLVRQQQRQATGAGDRFAIVLAQGVPRQLGVAAGRFGIQRDANDGA